MDFFSRQFLPRGLVKWVLVPGENSIYRLGDAQKIPIYMMLNTMGYLRKSDFQSLASDPLIRTLSTRST